MPSWSSLPELMLRRRRDLDLDQPTLATCIGVRQQTISRWESGQNVPGRKYISALADALKVDEANLHRIAGYQPECAITPVDQLFYDVTASADQFSDKQLLEMLDLLWRAYRLRAGHSEAASA